MHVSGIVTLTTDFGLDDGYVAQLHGVLLSAAADLRVVDLSHAMPPGNLLETLFLTESAWPRFPEGTVHVVVVDPGVGSVRGLVAVQTPDAFLVGPDTGVLSSGLPEASRPSDGITRVPLPDGCAGVDIRATPLARDAVSRTFHGRDLMAPVAAALATGRPLAEAGSPLTEIVAAAPLAARLTEGTGQGRILHVDRFGNAITSVRASDASARFTITVAGRAIDGPAESYADGGHDLAALASSSGYLEIALPNGSAASTLGIAAGEAVQIAPRQLRGA